MVVGIVREDHTNEEDDPSCCFHSLLFYKLVYLVLCLNRTVGRS